VLDAHVVKKRREFTVDVALKLASGDACGLFGVSGAGKSTILACIAGAEKPDAGRIVWDGLTLFPPPLPLHLRPIGYLTQDTGLFPHLSVVENVRFGLSNGTREGGEAWIERLRDGLELASFWNEPARAISGGQARRVALARMLARRPRLILLDEPFNGLDRHLVRELLVAVAEWQRELGFTLLVVDHDADVLSRLCPRVVAIESGRIVQDGPWDALYANPATELLARLLAPL
jgi:ABC-type sulfate/molybdate transport systems ATPase subunit